MKNPSLGYVWITNFFEKSEEGSKEGLSLIQGDVIKIKKKLKTLKKEFL